MALGYILGKNDYQFVNKSHMTSYQSAYTQAGIDLNSNYLILRKPHIGSNWLHPNTDSWSDNKLLRKCDIYRKATGLLHAGNYSYNTWNIAIAVMILDDEDFIMTNFKNNYIDYNSTPDIGLRMNANYDYLFHSGIMHFNYNGNTIDKSVKYVKYNSNDFNNGWISNGDFTKLFNNIVSSNNINIAEWTNPILLGVIESKAWYESGTGYHRTALSFQEFNDFIAHIRLNISGVSNLWNNYKVIDNNSAYTDNLTQVFSDTAYSNYIYKSLDLGNSYTIEYSVN